MQFEIESGSSEMAGRFWFGRLHAYAASRIAAPTMTFIQSILAGWGALMALTSCAPAEPRGPVVLAAASLQEVLDEIADDWAEQGNLRPVLSFAGTPALVRQIEHDVPADVFVSANREWMSRLATKRLLRPDTITVIAGNALVAINPANVEPYMDEFANVTAGRMALADPDNVPAGRYAKAALIAFGAWDDVQRDLVKTDNVRASLALVERGEVNAAVVYLSDAKVSGTVNVVHRFRTDSYPPIAYPAAVLASSKHDEAERFVAFLASPRAAEIVAEHGFLPPPGGAR